jgi:hypothetical protein
MANGAIDGRVTDDAGAPIAGATVRLLNAGLDAFTASDGSFSVSAVPVGKYNLLAGTGGYKACGRKDVRVAAGETTIVDFHLSTGDVVIPLSAYTTARERLGIPFPGATVKTQDHRLTIASLTDRNIEFAYRGLDPDTASKAFVATVRRDFRNDLEGRLLRVAEETYPSTKAVASVADRFPDRGALLKERRLWWYGDFDGVRLPYAVTMDAVRYYLELTQALGRGEPSHGIRMKRSKFVYLASISPGPQTFSCGREVFHEVYVVKMRLDWSDYCGSTCACGFNLDRTVVLRADGKVVCVLGDKRPVVAVS